MFNVTPHKEIRMYVIKEASNKKRPFSHQSDICRNARAQ